MKNILVISIALCFIIFLSAAVEAQQYIFVSQDPARVLNSPPLINTSPYKFYGNTNFGSPPWTTLQWYTHGSNAMNADLIDVINSYRSAPEFPSWIDISTSEATQPNADVTLNFTSCPAGAAACTYQMSYSHDLTRNVYTVKKYTIRFPNFSTYNDQQQHHILGHELGHVLGLHERYQANGLCSGENSVMDSLGCITLWGPTSLDIERLYRYYEACGQLSPWCGRMAPNPSSLNRNGTTVSSSWYNRNWITRYGHFTYLKSNSQNGPWTPFTTQLHTADLGFWEDKVPQTNNQYIAHISKNVGAQTNNDWVLICGKPSITWGVWGSEECMPNAVWVP